MSPSSGSPDDDALGRVRASFARQGMMNMLAPATGERIVAEGQVVRAGRTLTVCRGDAFTQGVERVHIATMLATIIGRQPT